MADIKTNLRELSVILGIQGYSLSNLSKLDPAGFIKIVRNSIGTKVDQANNLSSLATFSNDHLSIIKNGINLGDTILKLLPTLKKPYKIDWLGFDVQKEDPIDLTINGLGFSLKEDSFILENMGLYKFLNLITNSNFERGLHIFESFSKEKYNKWFLYSWGMMVDNCSKQSWTKNHKGNIYQIKVSGNFIEFIINDIVNCRVNRNIKSIEEYTINTNALVREKIFAKWIKEKLENDKQYIKLKKECSEEAGKKVVDFLNKNLKESGLSRFLQIYDLPYYYAKTTSTICKLYYVPPKSKFEENFKVVKIEYLIPRSQLNIVTTVKNLKTGKLLILRNELRFSHGQFNGTPEAKMYYDNQSDLSVIYEEIK